MYICILVYLYIFILVYMYICIFVYLYICIFLYYYICSNESWIYTVDSVQPEAILLGNCAIWQHCSCLHALTITVIRYFLLES